MASFQRIIQFLAASLLTFVSIHATAEPGAGRDEEATEYVLWVGGNAPGRAAREASVIHEALKRTEKEFGPFRLSVSSDTRLAGNWRQLLARGEQMQVVPTSYTDFPPEELTLIPVPIAGGKLGYRNLVVLRERLEEFEDIHSRAELAKFTAGQGSTWPDMWVYEANGLPIEGTNGIDALFAQLDRGAIDYLPLGVEETPSVLERYADGKDRYAIVPDLLIYYPLSSFPVVSNRHPDLIERLRLGLEAMHANGSLDISNIDDLDLEAPPDCRVIKLENPSRLFPLF